MKKILTIFIAAAFFTACKNDGKAGNNSTSSGTRAKDDYRNASTDKQDKTTEVNTTTSSSNDPGDSESTSNKDGWGDKENKKKWSSADESRFMSDCEGTATKNVGAARANEYCDCMLQKLTKHYSSYAEANSQLAGPDREMANKMVQECNGQ